MKAAKAGDALVEKRRRERYNPPFPLSSTWRKRSSTVEEVELRYIQEGIQNFVDVLADGKDYRVVWMGEEKVPGFSLTDKPLVYLGYGPVKGHAPCPPRLVDIVAAVGIHEAGHTKLKGVRDEGFYKDHSLVANILEDNWIEYQASVTAPVLGAYIDRMREYYSKPVDEYKARLDHPMPLSRDEVIALWVAVSLHLEKDVLDYLQWRTEPDQAAIDRCLDLLTRLSSRGMGDAATGDKGIAKSSEEYKRTVRSASAALDRFEAETQQMREDWIKNNTNPVTVAPMTPSSQQGNGSEDGDLDPTNPSSLGGGAGEQDDDGEQDHGAGDGDEGDDDKQEGASGGQGDEAQEEDGEEQAGDRGNGETEGEEGERDGQGVIGEASPQGSGLASHSHLPVDSAGDPADVMPDPLEPSVCQDEFLEEMPPELAGKVWEAQEHEAEDVSDVANHPRFILKKPGKTKRIPVSSRAAEEVRQAFETRRVMHTTRYPFQDQGKLSRRTIAHLPGGSRNVFEDELVEDDIDIALGILIDTSSSIGTSHHYGRGGDMRWGKGQWEIICEIAQVMVDAFKEGQLDLMVMAYHTGNVYRLYEPGWDDLHLLDVHPSGMTPSVPAMKVMIDRMRKVCSDRRDKFIIHLTDGWPNEGGGDVDMRRTVTEAQRKGFSVIGIGVGVPPEALAGQYDTSFSVETFTEVPARLRKIVEKL